MCFVLGCSVVNDPDDHRPGGDLPPIPAVEFCRELAQVMCEAHFDCCSAPTPASVDACVVAETSDCNDRIGDILLDPRAGYDERVAAEVIVEGRELSADCSTGDVVAWTNDRAGFLRVLRGTVEPGGECTPESLFDLAAYVSCSDLEQACVSAIGRSICADLVAEGGECNGNNDCGRGLYCEGFRFLLSSGMCAPTLDDGEACDANDDCTSRTCAGGLCTAQTPEALYCSILDVFR